jgi:hypothetical protein
MTPSPDPDSDEAREMLTGATRDLVLDMLAEIDIDELSTDALKQLATVLEGAAKRRIDSGSPPPAYEDSLAAEIERRRRQRGRDS